MNRTRELMLILLSPVMVLCYLIPWNNFLFSFLPAESPQLSIYIPVFYVALAAFSICKRNKPGFFSRRITFILFHLAGYFLTFYFIFINYYNIPFMLTDSPSRLRTFSSLKTFPGFLTALLLFLLSSILWKEASVLTRGFSGSRKTDLGFDKGLAFFLVLLLIKLIIVIKGGTSGSLDAFTPCFILYILLGFLTMGIARTDEIKQASGTSEILKIRFIVSVTPFSFIIFSVKFFQ